MHCRFQSVLGSCRGNYRFLSSAGRRAHVAFTLVGRGWLLCHAAGLPPKFASRPAHWLCRLCSSVGQLGRAAAQKIPVQF